MHVDSGHCICLAARLQCHQGSTRISLGPKIKWPIVATTFAWQDCICLQFHPGSACISLGPIFSTSFKSMFCINLTWSQEIFKKSQEVLVLNFDPNEVNIDLNEVNIDLA
jgi:hypothetical protein